MDLTQALEDHRIRHAKILEALETEKQRIAKEVQILQQSQSHRGEALTGELRRPQRRGPSQVSAGGFSAGGPHR